MCSTRVVTACLSDLCEWSNAVLCQANNFLSNVKPAYFKIDNVVSNVDFGFLLPNP